MPPTPTPTRMELVPVEMVREPTTKILVGHELRGPSSLSYPWPGRCNPASERAEIAAASWVASHGMLRDPTTAARFRGVGVGLLAAMAYPDASPKLLELIAQVMAWIFIQDDVYDTAPAKDQRPARLESQFERYLTVLRTGVVTPGAEPAVQALADLARRLSELGSPTWYLHFVETMRRFWMDGVVVETYYRGREISPDPASYMAMRVQTVGVYVCLDLLELTLDDELTPEVRDDPILRRITWLTSRIIAYVNDVFSYDKERRVGDVNNYLHVMQRCEPMSLHAVVDHTIRVHDRELEQLGKLDGTVRDHGPRMRTLVERYVDGCRAWMAGSLDWQRISSRYASGRALLEPDAAQRVARSG
jgi:5-epi-alpha-selinene synthase